MQRKNQELLKHIEQLKSENNETQHMDNIVSQHEITPCKKKHIVSLTKNYQTFI